MSTRISGVRDLDGHFQKMMSVKLSCEAAGIDYPEEVKSYFEFPRESEDTLRREMESVDIKCATTKVEYGPHDAVDGWLVDLSKLPAEVKAIRFENSY